MARFLLPHSSHSVHGGESPDGTFATTGNLLSLFTLCTQCSQQSQTGAGEVGPEVAQGTSREAAGVAGTRSQPPVSAAAEARTAVRSGKEAPCPRSQLAVQQGGTSVHPELGSAGQPSWVPCGGVAGQGTGSAWGLRVGSFTSMLRAGPARAPSTPPPPSSTGSRSRPRTSWDLSPL